MKNNMDMKNTNIKVKSVTFAEGTKEFDGTSKNNVKYYDFIMKFLKGDIRNSIDVYKFVKHEPQLLSFFFVQTVICILKLKLAEKRIQKVKTEVYYIPKDIEELIILKEWDTTLWNMKARLKATTSNDVGVLRYGSRDFSCKFVIGHIKYLNKLAGMLLKTRKLLIENASI